MSTPKRNLGWVVLASGMLLAASGTPASGQRVFVVPEGQTPTLGQTYTIEAKGGEELRLEVWIENLPQGERLEVWQVGMPCSAANGFAGSIDTFVLNSPEFNREHPDYVFLNLFESRNRWQSSAGCPVDEGTPSGSNGVRAENAVMVTDPKYMLTFIYSVSDSARGTFTIEPLPITPLCSPNIDEATWLIKGRDEAVWVCYENVAFGAITINVSVGRCCIVEQSCPQVCQEEVTQLACEDQGGRFTPDVDCEADCPAHCQLYGDVFLPQGNCLVDIDDLMWVLLAFADPDPCLNYPGSNIFPCGQACEDGPVDMDDVMALLGAFGGNYACPHPCAPE